MKYLGEKALGRISRSEKSREKITATVSEPLSGEPGKALQ